MQRYLNNKFRGYGKLMSIFCMTIFMQISASGFAQKITLSVKDASMESVLSELKKQSGYNILYNTRALVRNPLT